MNVLVRFQRVVIVAMLVRFPAVIGLIMPMVGAAFVAGGCWMRMLMDVRVRVRVRVPMAVREAAMRVRVGVNVCVCMLVLVSVLAVFAHRCSPYFDATKTPFPRSGRQIL